MTAAPSLIMPLSNTPKQHCPACRFFDGKPNSDGHCRRNPPTVTIIPVNNALQQVVPQPYTQFPPVRADWWCGEFKVKWDVDQAG